MYWVNGVAVGRVLWHVERRQAFQSPRISSSFLIKAVHQKDVNFTSTQYSCLPYLGCDVCWFCLVFPLLTQIKYTQGLRLSAKRFSWGQTSLRKTGCPGLFQNVSHFIPCSKNKRVFLWNAPWDPVERQSKTHKDWMVPCLGLPRALSSRLRPHQTFSDLPVTASDFLTGVAGSHWGFTFWASALWTLNDWHIVCGLTGVTPMSAAPLKLI